MAMLSPWTTPIRRSSPRCTRPQRQADVFVVSAAADAQVPPGPLWRTGAVEKAGELRLVRRVEGDVQGRREGTRCGPATPTALDHFCPTGRSNRVKNQNREGNLRAEIGWPNKTSKPGKELVDQEPGWEGMEKADVATAIEGASPPLPVPRPCAAARVGRAGPAAVAPPASRAALGVRRSPRACRGAAPFGAPPWPRRSHTSRRLEPTWVPGGAPPRPGCCPRRRSARRRRSAASRRRRSEVRAGFRRGYTGFQAVGPDRPERNRIPPGLEAEVPAVTRRRRHRGRTSGSSRPADGPLQPRRHVGHRRRHWHGASARRAGPFAIRRAKRNTGCTGRTPGPVDREPRREYAVVVAV